MTKSVWMHGSVGLKFAAVCLLSGTMMMEVGCTKKAPAPVGIRNLDGSITNPDGSITYPAGVTPPASSGVAPAPNQAVTVPPGTVPTPAPAPASQQPAPAAMTPGPAMTAGPAMAMTPEAPPPPVRLTVPAGTPVTVRLNGGLAASRNEVGDRWNGVLERPLVYHGQTVFASGTPVSGEVVAAKGKGRFKGAGDLGIELTAIGRDHVSSSEYEKVSPGRGKRTAGFIGGGGGLGAIIGGLAGGGKGALIGGLAGAGAGTAAGAYTGNRDVVIASESVITFRLRSSLTR
ncbi:hypothetical protein [Granulicella tundricola]|uniref:Uncharacterized protein n=1 Tax=Granulicella tundricola (strain ATCC BAA-1859 / DSM 23138 / MP5ACTX9) TaxID=1198114 RepID=E8WXP8_GRATM|nr:hypothetical protein [Granulicella tundricola]ADW68664.1 hypothetical protein AciX9_1611 [Granulicella tundricola MP5ACTX9]